MAWFRSVFIHEDDQAQIELLPMANWRFCEEQLVQVAAEQADMGIVRTDIHMAAGPPPLQLAGLSIPARSIEALIGVDFTRSNGVKASDSLQTWPLDGAAAFSVGAAPVFIVFRSPRRLVTAVWLEPSAHGEKTEETLTQALARIGSAHHLLLVDRLSVRLADLSDGASISDYIRNRPHHPRPGVQDG